MENFDVRIIEGYVITTTKGKNNAFDEEELKKMIKEHFQMKEELEIILNKFQELKELIVCR